MARPSLSPNRNSATDEVPAMAEIGDRNGSYGGAAAHEVAAGVDAGGHGRIGVPQVVCVVGDGSYVVKHRSPGSGGTYVAWLRGGQPKTRIRASAPAA